MNAPSRVLLTGQSGLGMSAMVRKLQASRPVEEVDYYSIEEAMRDLYVEDRPEMARHVAGPGGFQHLLFAPKPYLQKLWRRALDRLVARLRPDRRAIIAAHCAYFHTGFREYVGVIDVERLQSLGIAKVVTLIDDVYDVWARLTMPGQLLAAGYAAESGGSSVGQSMVDLLQLLDWRSWEVFAAEQVARSLGVCHLVLAVKHELDAVWQALFGGSQLVYVSHPITEPRRLISLENSRRMGERLVNEVEDLTHALATWSGLVPVCPTRIDELRFAQMPAAETGRMVPRSRLAERWQYPEEERILWVSPSRDSEEALDPDGNTVDNGGTLADLIPILPVLKDKITAQINSRDHKLVEQCNALVVWRPYFNGSVARGVEEEIQFRNRLVQYGSAEVGDRPCYVYSPQSDLAKWRANLVLQELGNLKVSVEKAVSVRDALLSDPAALLALGSGSMPAGQLEELAQAKGVMLTPPSSTSPSTALGGHSGALMNRWIRDCWGEIASRANSTDLIKDALCDGDLLIDKDGFQPNEFVREIEHTRRQHS